MAIDKDLTLRAASAGNLTASKTDATFVDFGGGDLVPQTYRVMVPSVVGTNPTLDIKIQESSDGTNANGASINFPQITAAGEYFVTWKASKRYRRFYATVGGTTPNFGAVTIAPVPAGRGPSR